MITKAYSKLKKNLFISIQKRNPAMNDAIKNGLNIDKYYEELMEVASNQNFEKLCNSSLIKYIMAERRIELASLILEYEKKSGEVYKYNYNKYIVPHLLENGEYDEEYVKSTLEEMNSNEKFLSILHGGMQDYMLRPEAEYVLKPGWEEYFENIDYIYVDEKNKSIIAIHEEVIYDVGTELNYISYSSNSPFISDKFHCEDKEMNFLVECQLKRTVTNRGGNYPLSKEELIPYLYRSKYRQTNTKVYVVDKSEANIDGKQYFWEQLQKIESNKMKKKFCEYTFDFGVIFSNPFQKTNAAYFGLVSDENEFNYENGKVRDTNNVIDGQKDILRRKFEAEYNEWFISLDEDEAEEIINRIEEVEIYNREKYGRKPKRAQKLRELRSQNN